MKKILSLLSAVVLTSTASTSIIACGEEETPKPIPPVEKIGLDQDTLKNSLTFKKLMTGSQAYKELRSKIVNLSNGKYQNTNEIKVDNTILISIWTNDTNVLKDEDKDINLNSIETVDVKITVTENNKVFKKLEMVLSNIKLCKTNLSGLPDNVTVNKVHKNNVDDFIKQLVGNLISFKEFKELSINDINVYKKGTTDHLQNEDIVDNPNLEITIQAVDTSDTSKWFEGTKDISVNLKVLIKTNLSGLPDNVTVDKVFKNDVQNFIGKLVSVLGSNNGFNVLDRNDINVYKKGTTDDLQNEDIVDNPNLEITIQADDTSTRFEGTKNISVNLTIFTKTNLNGLPDEVNIGDVKANNVKDFIDKLVNVFHKDPKFNKLQSHWIDVYKKDTSTKLNSTDIVNNPNLEITVKAKTNAIRWCEGTKDISVNLTVK